jgi:hypothetical protein
MSSDGQVERCLALIGHVSDGFVDDVMGLADTAWGGPTNCPPWRVRDRISTPPATLAWLADGRLELPSLVASGEARVAVLLTYRRG